MMTSLSRTLLVFSVISLVASASLVRTYGNQFYFVVFHKPVPSLHAKSVSYTPKILPIFNVKTALAVDQLTAGDSQVISLSITTDRNVDAQAQVWITGPNNKQVFRSPDGAIYHFVKDVPQTVQYTFVPTAAMPLGKYAVSEIILSTDGNTDYQVNQRFAEFNVL